MAAGNQEGTTHHSLIIWEPGTWPPKQGEIGAAATQNTVGGGRGRRGTRYSDTLCGLNVLSELRYFHKQFQHCAGLYTQSNGTQLYLSNAERLCVNSSL